MTEPLPKKDWRGTLAICLVGDLTSVIDRIELLTDTNPEIMLQHRVKLKGFSEQLLKVIRHLEPKEKK